jgi:two-component system nitrogen regulation response regulator NtrX
MPKPKTKFDKIAFVASEMPEALAAQGRLAERYGDCDPAEADAIVALGGDGHMLQTLHRFMNDGVPIFVPSLRERAEDVALLADHFMALLAREYGRRPKTFEPDAIAALQRYRFPGNVRELRNLVERLMIMVPGERVSSRDLTFLEQPVVSPDPTPSSRSTALAPLHHARDEFEKQYILRALANQHGNMSRTAEVLGVERSNLYKKMRAFGIMPSRRGDDEDVA